MCHGFVEGCELFDIVQLSLDLALHSGVRQLFILFLAFSHLNLTTLFSEVHVAIGVFHRYLAVNSFGLFNLFFSESLDVIGRAIQALVVCCPPVCKLVEALSFVNGFEVVKACAE